MSVMQPVLLWLHRSRTKSMHRLRIPTLLQQHRPSMLQPNMRIRAVSELASRLPTLQLITRTLRNVQYQYATHLLKSIQNKE